ncbi:uncharacterized protein LOC115728264 isoform X2 [Rhodamnia argentea]|uniref:Uncharacterized protein LOC115728264 isoform X2 n=1 Tax=Rhodamnia argentea TaxID=178133 RepID=A0A8B8MWK1_9MYRT|nr:uncharacterized protein LOC115728264 isoform X2 [Rhodamnia argentea]
MTTATTPSNSSAHHLDSLAPSPPPPGTQSLNGPSESDARPFPCRDSLADPSMEDLRCGERGSSRAWVAEQERGIEREIVRTICSGNADSLKPNSGKAVAVGEHYICVSFHDGVDPSYRTWEWHGHVMALDGNNGYVPEHIYGNYLERVDAAGLYGEEDEDGTEDSGIPIVLGNVNLRFNRFN